MPQTRRLKQQTFFCLLVLDAGSLRSTYEQSQILPSMGFKGNIYPASLLASCGLLAIFGALGFVDVSPLPLPLLSHSVLPACDYVPISPGHKIISDIALEVHPNYIILINHICDDPSSK